MPRLTPLFALAAFAVVLSTCYGPEPRPFAGRGGRSLDRPPRYGEPSRYVEPIAPMPVPTDIPLEYPAHEMNPGGTGVDPGIVVTPPGVTTPAPEIPGGAPTPPSPAPQPTVPTDVPFARKVPGQPSQVYSLKDPKRVISVEGLRPGQKARDPVTGEIFRVPY